MAFAEDKDNTLWFSAGGARAPVVGWLNTKKFLETGDAAASQGWSAFILDTNGNGKRDEGYVEPNQPVDPSKDKRIVAGLYGIGYDPNDGTIWGSVLSVPGGVIHVIPGDNPPATTLSEYYEVPFNEPKAAVNGFGPRGMDIDRNGVVWIPLASGHLASFDRKKCKGPLNGPTIANGRHCPEGWTLHQFPGPQFEGLNEPGAVQSSYYTWVDQFDTFGLGKNVPIATGNMSDSLEAFVDGKFVIVAGALSDGLPRQGARWPHRRRHHGVERPRALVDLCRPCALSHRRRQGHDQQGGEIPAPPRSAGAVGGFYGLFKIAHDGGRYAAGDDTGQAELDLAAIGRRDAAERERALADLALPTRCCVSCRDPCDADRRSRRAPPAAAWRCPPSRLPR